jgi:hypothetical protein
MASLTDKVYVCTLCQKIWTTTTLPENAVQLTTGHGGGSSVYRFKDGSIHVLKVQSTKEQ